MSKPDKPDQGKEQFSVWGGRFDVRRWADFLAIWRWPDEPRWGIWEFIDCFYLDHGARTAPEQFPALERVELFGPSGHLSARRDNGQVYWHFVGQEQCLPEATDAPERLAEYGGASYWETHPGEKFYRDEQRVLLWGEQIGQSGHWQEDRVGWANLAYPGVGGARARLAYTRYSRAGQVAFVRYTGLEDAEVQHGNR